MSALRRMPRFLVRQVFFPVVLLVSVSILTFTALVLPWNLRSANLPLQVGDVAPQDLAAPRNVEYVSQVRTEAARSEAEADVAPVYAAPDAVIARRQIESLRTTLQDISAVRVDETSTLEQKQTALTSLEGVTLKTVTIFYLLNVSESRWEDIQSETINVLEQVMRSPVFSEELDATLEKIPSLVSLSMSETEAAVIGELAGIFIVPNSFYSPEMTAAARQAARNSVQPVIYTYVEGQIIVTRGQVISAADYEALTVLGLIQSKANVTDLLGAAALVVLAAMFTVLYFHRKKPVLLTDLRSLILLALLFLLFLFGARLTIPNRTVVPYLYPIPAFGMLVSVLFSLESGMVFSLLLGVIAAYGMPNSLDLTIYYLMASLCGVLALGQARRVSTFVRATGAVAGAGAAVILSHRLPFVTMDWLGAATLAGAALLSAVASTSITLLLQYLLAQFLGLTTALHLLEISRPDFPLLVKFLRSAPGTYQHSLHVANMAEQAAERIGADTLLTRVGALYHDVGKSENPAFFVENQPPDVINPHDDLDPRVSAATIIRHVSDGLELAKEFRLPRRIRDFIAEHHGTLIARYQYNHALEAAAGDASKVDKESYRYPGPPPASRETALLMLADGVEAHTRAEHPKSDDELRAIVRSVFDSRKGESQLDNTPITQRDLSVIAESFLTTLRGTYHPRLQYPQEEPRTAPASAHTRARKRK